MATRRRALEEAPGFFAAVQNPTDNATAQPAAARPATPHHVGHRERLRQRFHSGGQAALHDYEMLELVLFRAIPRGDVKPLAKRLLAEFGDFAHVLAAPIERLTAVKGLGPAAAAELKIVEAAAHRLARARVLDRPALSSWTAVVDYCRTVMAHRRVEEFHGLFLNTRNVLIADEVLNWGTINHTPAYPREVARRALALDAMAVVIAHNHPSGDPTPSDADIAMTARIDEALRAVGVTLHDHLIIGKGAETSFRAQGLL
jgi:DNA repair protein RadC